MFLSIDVGTTSTKCFLISQSGEIVQSAQTATKLILPQTNWVEQDPEELFESVVACLTKLNTEQNVQACGITNQRESIVAFRRSTGRPICNAIIWMDTRTKGIVEEYKQRASTVNGRVGRFENMTGLKFSTFFSVFKILWILENSAEAKTASIENDIVFCTIESWILYRLTGRKVLSTDTSNANRTFLFNLNTMDWDPELLEFFAIKRQWLPEVCPCFVADGFGRIDKSFPFSGTLINTMIADQQASLIGHWGKNFEGKSKCTFGTGAFLLCSIPNHLKIRSDCLQTVLFSSTSLNSSSCSFADEFPIICAGSLVSWLQNMIQIIQDPSELDGLDLHDRSSPADAVYFIPHLSGCLFPLWNPNVRGSFQNISLKSSKNDMLLAVLESIAFSVKLAFDHIKIDTLSVDGGMCNNQLFCKILADICNCNIRILKNNDATGFGAALIASNFTIPLHESNYELITPHPDNLIIYEEMFLVWKEKITLNK